MMTLCSKISIQATNSIVLERAKTLQPSQQSSPIKIPLRVKVSSDAIKITNKKRPKPQGSDQSSLCKRHLTRSQHNDVTQRAHFASASGSLNRCVNILSTCASLGFPLGWLCERITAAALSHCASLTTSRGYTDALSIVPWNISRYSTNRSCVSRNSIAKT